jgi:CxxC motif-containing protein
MPVLPVRTNGEVPKEKIRGIMRELAKIVITKKIDVGETVAANIAETGCDIIATSRIRVQEELYGKSACVDN